MEFQIEIDDLGLKVLSEIKERTGLSGYKEIFNSGLTLLDWATRQQASGKIVAAVDENTQRYKEVEMAAFDSARRRGNSKAKLSSDVR